MNLLSNKHRPLLFFIVVVALIRLVISPMFGLGVDEAHYVLYAKNLALSYFDHPPLIGWVQYIFTAIFGDNEFGARVGAIVMGFVATLLLYKLIYNIDKDVKSSFMAIISLHSTILFNIIFLMILPDTLLLPLMLLIIFSVINITKNNNIFNWIILGILLGLAGLAKYSAILFIPPIFLYIIIKRRFDLVINKNILWTIITAIIIILPVIFWNIDNHWLSFTYQANHVIGSTDISFKKFILSIFIQFVVYNPLLMPVAFYGLYRSFKANNDYLFLSALFGATIILFFSYASLYEVALPHWNVAFYFLFVPIGSYYLFTIYKKYVKFAVFFGLLLSIMLYAEVAFKFIPQDNYKSIHRDIYGWDIIMKRANKKLMLNESLAVSNWTQASRAMYYNNSYNSTVYLIDDRYDQFDIWQHKLPIHQNILFINSYFFNNDIKKLMLCDHVNVVDNFDIKLNNYKVNSIRLIRCTNFQGIKEVQ